MRRDRITLVSAGERRVDLVELSGATVRWSRIWGVPKLGHCSNIEWSSRMTKSLGVCYPRKGTVRLAAYLQTAKRALVEEVLCHEMAHLAARELHGDGIRPHGREWKRLMEAAGYAPTTRLVVPAGLQPSPLKKKRRRRFLYIQFCSICERIRITHRSMRRSRCRACVDAGLDGVVTVIRKAR